MNVQIGCCYSDKAENIEKRGGYSFENLPHPQKLSFTHLGISTSACK